MSKYLIRKKLMEQVFVLAHGLREISVRHSGEGTAVGITYGSGGCRNTVGNSQ